MAAITGCASGTSSSIESNCGSASGSNASASSGASTPVAGAAFAVRVLGALQPVSGASVQLYAAGSTGNGSAPAALLAAGASTDANGNFQVPGEYTCPSAETPVYLLSKGGRVGAGSTANPSLWLMTALGPCGSIGSGSTFFVNEVTTAASVWALAPFMSSGANVGASCTNLAGLTNAFLTTRNLVEVTSGVSPGASIPSTLAVPTSKLNTLANALASCAGSSNGNSCTALFGAAAIGSTVPQNTLDAALDIAHAPGANVGAIYLLASATGIFAPALQAAPPDWMLSNTIAGGGMSSPASIGVAASGNIWVSSYFNTVSEFSPDGAAIFPAGIGGYGINQSYGMALDIKGSVWIANEQTGPNAGTGDIAELSQSGSALATGLTSGGIDFPVAVAADSSGNMWIADYGDSKVTLLDGSGAPVSGSGGWGGASLAFPVALAVDSNHNAWVANQAGQLPITRISADGSQLTNFNCDCDGASGIAVDQKGNVWVANYYSDSISELNSSGTLLLDAETGGGLKHPNGIGVDGAGSVWVTNYLGNSLSEISGSSSAAPGSFLSPSGGFGTDASLLQPFALAIDASGNIWVSTFGNSTLTQFIGVASPVETPLIGPPRQP
ncbi:MAG: NHL repeat-containing protein [Terracidiphilus sp.]